MRVLLDECVPRGIRRYLRDHQVLTVQEQGWAGLKNGALLREAASAGFRVFLTLDRGVPYQQNLAGSSLGLIIVRAPSNDINVLQPLAPLILRAIESAAPGSVALVSAPATRS